MTSTSGGGSLAFAIGFQAQASSTTAEGTTESRAVTVRPRVTGGTIAFSEVAALDPTIAARLEEKLDLVPSRYGTRCFDRQHAVAVLSPAEMGRLNLALSTLAHDKHLQSRESVVRVGVPTASAAVVLGAMFVDIPGALLLSSALATLASTVALTVPWLFTGEIRDMSKSRYEAKLAQLNPAALIVGPAKI